MPMTRFERIPLAQFLMGGLAIVFVACVLIKHAQAQSVVSTGTLIEQLAVRFAKCYPGPLQ
jgi:hypothetical protein